MGSIGGSRSEFDGCFPDEEANAIGAAQAIEERRTQREAYENFVKALENRTEAVLHRLSLDNLPEAVTEIELLFGIAAPSVYGFPVSVLCIRLKEELRNGKTTERFIKLVRMLKEERARLCNKDPLPSTELLNEVTEFNLQSEGSNSSYRHFGSSRAHLSK